jgi:toxin HigB-1
LKAARILSLLDAAASSESMNLPGHNLHPLKDDLVGFWSISVNKNWRIIFRFEDGAAIDVDFVDYH